MFEEIYLPILKNDDVQCLDNFSSFFCDYFNETKKQEVLNQDISVYYKHNNKDELEAISRFGIAFAKEFCQRIQKKYEGYLSNVTTELKMICEMTCKEFIHSFPSNTVVTSFLWNKKKAFFTFYPDVIHSFLLKQFPKLDFRDFKYRQMSEIESIFYRENIEPILFESVLKSCKSNELFTDNLINLLNFTSKELITSDLKEVLYPNETNDMIDLHIDLCLETPLNNIYSAMHLLLDWSLVKDIASNIR